MRGHIIWKSFFLRNVQEMLPKMSLNTRSHVANLHILVFGYDERRNAKRDRSRWKNKQRGITRGRHKVTDARRTFTRQLWINIMLSNYNTSRDSEPPHGVIISLLAPLYYFFPPKNLLHFSKYLFILSCSSYVIYDLICIKLGTWYQHTYLCCKLYDEDYIVAFWCV